MADILSIVKDLFTYVPERSTREEATFICPACHDATGNRSVNLKTGRTACWRCGAKPGEAGNFFSWLRRHGYNVEAAETHTIRATEADVLLNQVEEERFIPTIKEVTLPSGFTRLADDPNSGYSSLVARMATRKGLDFADLAAVDVGYTKTNQLWEPYAIFPVKEYGRVVYYQGRTYVDEPGKSTKRFPSRSECPYGASYWVYNIDAVIAQRPALVVVVEAVLNVLSLAKLGCPDFVPVCVFKHSISRVQLQKLTSFKYVKEICILYDSDSVGNAWAEAGHRVANRVKVSIARMPVPAGRKKTDPNDDPQLALEAIAQRTPYTSSGELQSLLDTLK